MVWSKRVSDGQFTSKTARYAGWAGALRARGPARTLVAFMRERERERDIRMGTTNAYHSEPHPVPSPCGASQLPGSRTRQCAAGQTRQCRSRRFARQSAAGVTPTPIGQPSLRVTSLSPRGFYRHTRTAAGSRDMSIGKACRVPSRRAPTAPNGVDTEMGVKPGGAARLELVA